MFDRELYTRTWQTFNFTRITSDSYYVPCKQCSGYVCQLLYRLGVALSDYSSTQNKSEYLIYANRGLTWSRANIRETADEFNRGNKTKWYKCSLEFRSTVCLSHRLKYASPCMKSIDRINTDIVYMLISGVLNIHETLRRKRKWLLLV